MVVRHALASVILFCVACEGSRDVGTQRVPGETLLLELRSYMSREDAERFLASHGAHTGTAVATKQGPARGEGRPVAITEIDSFPYRGTTGRLTATFYNDRLMAVLFFAEKAALTAALDTLFPGHATPAGFARGNLVVRSATDYRGAWYVSWEDRRLAREFTSKEGDRP